MSSTSRRYRVQGRRLVEAERLHEEVQREPGVDDVLDDEDMPALDRPVDVFQEADAAALVATALIGTVGRELHDVQRVRDRERAREIGQEHDARLEGRDQQWVESGVVAGDLGAELGDAHADRGARQVHVADLAVVGAHVRRLHRL
jgi:hypothetical protein